MRPEKKKQAPWQSESCFEACFALIMPHFGLKTHLCPGRQKFVKAWWRAAAHAQAGRPGHRHRAQRRIPGAERPARLRLQQRDQGRQELLRRQAAHRRRLRCGLRFEKEETRNVDEEKANACAFAFFEPCRVISDAVERGSPTPSRRFFKATVSLRLLRDRQNPCDHRRCRLSLNNSSPSSREQWIRMVPLPDTYRSHISASIFPSLFRYVHYTKCCSFHTQEKSPEPGSFWRRLRI